jgi:hypothetical protein
MRGAVSLLALAFALVMIVPNLPRLIERMF